MNPATSNPYALEYEPVNDPCILQPTCDMAAKMTAHINWLGAQCERGHEAACQKLKQGLSPDYRGPGPDPFPGVAPGGSETWGLAEDSPPTGIEPRFPSEPYKKQSDAM